MNETRYTEDHQWLQLDETGEVVVGITGYAQEQLGDIVFVELPAVGTDVASGDEIAVVESVKAASDIRAALSGEISAVNERLADEPELINADPEGDGWFFKMTVDDETTLAGFMDEDSYKELIKQA
ncbi:MAG: glycine cleavage system protein GcvH [Gammaproteobacteria bacterium]